MKVIILVAGNGKRLMPLTEITPKCLIEINGETIIEKIIKKCSNIGISDFVIVVGYKKELVTQKLSDLFSGLACRCDYRIVENIDYDTTNSGISLYLALKDNKTNDDIAIINGDLLFDKRILDMLINKDTTSTIIENKKKLTEESFKVILENNKIKSIGKDIPIELSDGEFIGFSLIKLNDIYTFKDILEKMVIRNKRQYYSCVFKKFSEIIPINFIFTNGLKCTDIDVIEDLNYAKEIIEEIK